MDEIRTDKLNFIVFNQNTNCNWKDIQNHRYFHDVTLACDDKHIETNKIILSSFSPFFKKLLKHHPQKHPLFFLRGVQFTEMSNILDFIYQGETNIDSQSLAHFLSVAHDLEIKGLTISDRKNVISVSRIEPDFFNKYNVSKSCTYPTNKRVRKEEIKEKQ